MRSRALSILLAVALVIGLVACGGDGEESASADSSGSPGPTANVTVRVFFLRGGKLGPVGRESLASTPATTAMNQLLEGPDAMDTASGMTTAIPTGVQLNGIAIADKVATVDLTKNFEEGADQPTMQQRIAQVVYTVRQFPSITGVLFQIDGQPVTSLGGVPVDHPQTRDDWESEQPAISIGAPLPYTQVTSPIQVAGTANTFEATFHLKVTDSTGAELADTTVAATSGSGTRGSFNTFVTFTGGAKGPLTLTGYEVSAENGQPINPTDIPLQLA